MDVLMTIVFCLFYIFLLALPFIGLFQIIGFFVRLFKWKEMSLEEKKNMKIYGSTVLIYFVLIVVFSFFDIQRIFPKYNDGIVIIYFGVLPFLIAIYYWTSIYKNYDHA